MRVLIVALLISVFLPNGIAQAQSPAISSGDTLSYELLAPTLQPGQAIVFEKKPDRILKVTISDNGDRSYDHRSGKNFAVRDAFATKIVSHGNPIDEAYQFRHFPLGKTPEPGSNGMSVLEERLIVMGTTSSATMQLPSPARISRS